MEQRYLTEAKQNDEFLRQAPFEISINRIMDMIDNENTRGYPILNELTALYQKCIFLENKEIDDLYNKIYSDKKIYYDKFYTFFNNRYGKCNVHNRPKGWIKYKPPSYILQQTALYTYKKIMPDCDKLYNLIIKDLISKGLILPRKGLLGSSHLED